MNLSKKGISPLIATVLVIGFTVALAAVILTWGTGFTKKISKSTEETTETQLACAQDVNFDVTAACYDMANDGVQFIVENNGNRDLTNFSVRLKISATDVVAGNVPSSTVPRFGLKTFFVTDLDIPDLLGRAGEVKEVTLVPVIKVGDKEVTCSQSIATYGAPISGELLPECEVA